MQYLMILFAAIFVGYAIFLVHQTLNAMTQVLW